MSRGNDSAKERFEGHEQVKSQVKSSFDLIVPVIG